MSHTATEPTEAEVLQELADDLAVLATPKFERIEPTASRTCDRHPSTYALVEVTLPNGGKLELCGNCGRRHFAYEHTFHTTPENKTQGSAN